MQEGAPAAHVSVRLASGTTACGVAADAHSTYSPHTRQRFPSSGAVPGLAVQALVCCCLVSLGWRPQPHAVTGLKASVMLTRALSLRATMTGQDEQARPLSTCAAADTVCSPTRRPCCSAELLCSAAMDTRSARAQRSRLTKPHPIASVMR